MTFDQEYTHARAQIEGGDWKLRAEIADLEAQVTAQAAEIAMLKEKLRYAMVIEATLQNKK